MKKDTSQETFYAIISFVIIAAIVFFVLSDGKPSTPRRTSPINDPDSHLGN